ncbi:MAG: AAA family ATPase [Candidatus Electrothrix sp. Rat3]|nr:AAA family ATPase [Candidatus Electrothrix rattekaaiensis]
MIKEIELIDWKSFKRATLFIDPLTILIGANASGKSNALDALVFLQRISSGVALTSSLQGDVTISEIRGGVDWANRRGQNSFTLKSVVSLPEERTEFIYSIEIEIIEQRCQIKYESLIRRKFRPKTEKNPYEIRLFWTDDCIKDSPSITVRLYNEKKGSPRPCARTHSVLAQLFIQADAGLRKEISHGVKSISKGLKSIFILDPIPSHMRDYSSLSEELKPDASNIAGVIAALPKESKNNIERTLTHYIKNLPEKDVISVYSEHVGKFEADAMLYCEEKWVDSAESKTIIDAKGMSDGTLRFLAILVALLTRPHDSLLVVEEIDNGLHPSRSQLLVKVLKEIGQKRAVDILITTHNPALLDSLGEEMIPFVTITHRDSQNGFSKLTLLEEIESLPKLLAGGSIGKLSSEGKIEGALQFSQKKYGTI